ncbi:MAG: hypothetical protein ABIQ45_15465 [Devosia sp.]
MMTDKQVTEVPYASQYRQYLARMNAEEISAIRAALNELIDGTEINTAGWMPGANWIGTAYEPIYRKAARQNTTTAAKCFGLMVWEVFMDRPERWYSGRFEKDGEPIGSRTYFRPQL